MKPAAGEPTPNHLIESLLLRNKTRPPARRADSASRYQLIDAAGSSSATLVTVTAPAGYGKSTLLAEWCASEPRATGWLSLDSFDNNPATLTSLITAAATSIIPGIDTAFRDLRGSGTDSLSHAAPLLAAMLTTAPTPFVLFLDDLHYLESDGCHDVLEVLAAAIPSGSQLVCAGRCTAALFGRLRARIDVHEISVDQLRLEPSAATSILESAGVTGSSAADIDAVVTACEGWPTGIRLSALVASADGDYTPVTGRSAFIADYLFAECLRRIPDDLRVFLRRSAVLDRLSASACDAILGVSNARAQLRRAEEAGLFVQALDNEREWYRFHSLFREVLLDDLERAEGSAAVAALHRRTALWLVDHNAANSAVNHFLAAGDRRQAADLVAEIALPLYQQGKISIVQDWFQQIGDATIRDHWQLAIAVTWCAILTGDVAAGERWLAVLDDICTSSVPTVEQDEFESSRAMIRAATCGHGFRQAAIDAQLAVEYEKTSSPWLDQAQHLRGSLFLLEGDPANAAAYFQAAVAQAAVMDNPDSIVLSVPELALLDIAAGRWDRAQQWCSRGVDIARRQLDGYPTTVLALAVAARVALHDGHRAYGEELLNTAMRCRVDCTYLMPWLAIRGRLQLAEAHLALGATSAACLLMEESSEILRHRPDLGALCTEIERVRARCAPATHTDAAVPLTAAELRLIPFLQTHLTIGQIADRLFVSRNTVNTQLGSVYRKFGVNSRSQAVERATALGMIGTYRIPESQTPPVPSIGAPGA